MKQDWALLIGFGLVVTGCCGALAYVAAGGSDTTYTLLTGLALLVAGEVMLLILMVRQQDTFNEKISILARNCGELRVELRSKMDMAFNRIQQVQAESRDRTESMIGGISELKTSYSTLQKSLSEKVANAPARKQRREPVLIAAPTAVAPAAAPVKAPVPVAEPPSLRASIPASLADKINFSLEPVVDMRSRRTAHYRLHSSMQVGRVELEGQPLLEQVTQAGLRTQFDALAIDETLGLLSRLRQRDGELCIILPVGPETLADEASVERIMAACEEAGDAGRGLVLEIRHSMLPLFTPRALEGLAELSRGGQAFALADASPEALDLSAMKMLHVKMVGLDINELQHVEGLEATAKFAKQARLHGISSIVTHVTDPQLIQRLTQVTPLACGPCFASPRRVKRGAQTEDNGRKISQAA